MQKSHKYENVKDVLGKGMWVNTNETWERKKRRESGALLIKYLEQ